MKKNDLRVLRKLFNQASDAYLILGRKKDNSAKRPYVLGWQSRHSDEVVHARTYKHLDSVKNAFNEHALSGGPDLHTDFFEDPCQYTVYGWEEQFLHDDQKISKKQAEKLIAKVSADYKMKPPKLKWKKEEDGASEYDPDKHKITLGIHDTITVLHELAHALEHVYYEDDLYSNHSPTFVWTAIELYHAYAGFNMAYLVTSAKRAGVLGDLDAPQLLEAENLKQLKPQKPYRA